MAKLFLITLSLLICFLTQAQDDLYPPDKNTRSSQNQELSLENFLIENSNLIWQRTYQTDISIREQKEKFKNLSVFETITSEDDNEIRGHVKAFENDYKGAGYGELLTPIYVSRKSSSGTLIVQFKEGRYRVTFMDIRLEQDYNDTVFERGETNPLSDYALNESSRWRGHFKRDGSKILDYTYQEKFDISKAIELSDDF